MTDSLDVAVVLGLGGSSSTTSSRILERRAISCGAEESFGSKGSVGHSFGAHWEYKPNESSAAHSVG
jgi:hypothetical protein